MNSPEKRKTNNNAQQYALIVEYCGTGYCGFQIQESGPTIQNEIEKALVILLRHKIRASCAGRTDSGVHATGQVVTFFSSSLDFNEYRFVYSLNSILPDSICVRHATLVPDDFHPRYSCLAREYEYFIWNAKIKPGLLKNRVLWYDKSLPIEILNAELNSILGEKDFAALTAVKYKDETTRRYIDRAELTTVSDKLTDSNELVILKIRGNAFLHKMIRILVGTLLDIVDGKINQSLVSIVESRNRLLAGRTAPPHGLYFRRAYFPEMQGVEHLNTIEDYPVYREIKMTMTGKGI